MLVLLLFSIITLRHARQHHHFLLRQLTLEEGYRQMSAQAMQALRDKNTFLTPPATTCASPCTPWA